MLYPDFELEKERYSVVHIHEMYVGTEGGTRYLFFVV